MAAGQRHREALAAELDPHAGESARLAAMAQEAESTLAGLQARTPLCVLLLIQLPCLSKCHACPHH